MKAALKFTTRANSNGEIGGGVVLEDGSPGGRPVFIGSLWYGMPRRINHIKMNVLYCGLKHARALGYSSLEIVTDDEGAFYALSGQELPQVWKSAIHRVRYILRRFDRTYRYGNLYEMGDAPLLAYDALKRRDSIIEILDERMIVNG